MIPLIAVAIVYPLAAIIAGWFVFDHAATWNHTRYVLRHPALWW